MARRYLLPAIVVAGVVSGIAGVVTFMGAPAIAATETAATPANPKVAEVNGEMILKSDVQQLYDAIKTRMGEGSPPMDKVFWTLTDQIIASRLIINAANQQGIADSPQVQQALKAAKEQIVQEAFIRKTFDGLDNDATLKPLYNKVVESMKGESEVHARHILVDSEDKAKSLIEQLNKGADFAKLAADNSKDPGSASKGGDLGFFARGMMVPEFDTVAFALEPGKVSQTPVHTQFGWHILKVDERRPRQAPKYEDVKPQLLAKAQQDKLNATIEQLKEKGKVERFAGAGLPPVPGAQATAKQ